MNHRRPSGPAFTWTTHDKLDELLYRTSDLIRENAELRQALAEAQQTIEDVCVGTRLECPKCGMPRPCLCQDK